MSIESVMLSNHLILCCPLLLLPSVFPSSKVFYNESPLHLGGQCIGASASASVLPVNIQGWFPFGLTALISLLSKGLSRVFSSTTIWKHQFFGSQPSLWFSYHIHTWLLEKPQLWLYQPLSAKWFLLFNTLSRFAIAFLPRSKHLNFMLAVIICSDFGAPKNKVCHCFHFFPLLFAMK